MRLLDKIALQRLITLFLNFILAILKLFVPQAIDDMDKPEDKRRIWRPKWRKKT